MLAEAFLGARQSQAYTASTVPFRWDAIHGTPISLSDDEVSAPIPLPFRFNFLHNYPFLVSYAQVSIGSNGFITFAPGQADDCSGQAGPCAGQLLPAAIGPNALVAGYWEDLDPSAGGSISYGTIGTAPDRIFVVEFGDVPHAPSGNPVSFQIRLFEASNDIEIHCKSCLSDGGNHTQGIESESWNEGGTSKTRAVCYTTNPALGLYLYGYQCSLLDGTGTLVKSERNFADFSLTNDAVRFRPPSNRSAIAPVLSDTSIPPVKLRYQFRVDRNEAFEGIGPDFKLLFGFTGLYNQANYQSGANTDVYELDSAFYAQGMRYQDPLCFSGYVPPSQLVTYNREATFRIGIPDYPGKGFTGARTDAPSVFPRATSLGMIDGIASASSLVSQLDITGKNGSYVLSRAGLITDKSGWRYRAATCDPQGVCTCQEAGLDPGNPSHAFRQWDQTITFDGTPYTTHVALPDDAASALVPWGPLSFVTEYFFTKGRYSLYLWGLEAQAEGSSEWLPFDRWHVLDHDGSTKYFGFRLARLGGQCVLEVGNDPTERSAFVFGTGSGSETPVFDLTTCSVEPSASTGPATNVGARAATLHGVANASGGTGTAWFEYGPTASYGFVSSSQPIAGSAEQGISIPVSGLQPGTVSFYRIVSSTEGGAVRGSGASFRTGIHTLLVAKNGAGDGVVKTSPVAINCGPECRASFASGVTVTLKAIPGSGSTFEGWAGEGCAGTGDCTVSMSQDRSVSAVFTSTVAGRSFHPLAPCRLLDTRNPRGSFGGPAIGAAGTPDRPFGLSDAGCGIPPDASAASVNITVVNPTAAGDLAVYPADVVIPSVATNASFGPGRTRAVSSTLRLAQDGHGTVKVQNRSSGEVHLIIDANGYFAASGSPISCASTLPGDFGQSGMLFESLSRTAPEMAPLDSRSSLDVTNGSRRSIGPGYVEPTAFFPWAIHDLARNVVLLHPGSSRDASLGVSVCEAGLYRISGAFARGNDFRNAGDGVSVRVLRGSSSSQGSALQSGSISSDNEVPQDYFSGTGVLTFDVQRYLYPGEVIRFAVSVGAGTDQSFDATAVRGSVQLVGSSPEAAVLGGR